MKTIIALFVITLAAFLTGCATSTPAAPRTAGDYCKQQAHLAAARSNMVDRNALSGRPTDLEKAIYEDCVVKVTTKK
jgi:starvation-inducible outer membrane lipoprotein